MIDFIRMLLTGWREISLLRLTWVTMAPSQPVPDIDQIFLRQVRIWLKEIKCFRAISRIFMRGKMSS